MSSIQVKAVQGATWTIAAGLLTRGLGLLASIVITYLINPDVMGEVGAAVIFVQTAHTMSILGVGHYLVAKPDKGRDVTFHITVINAGLGLVAALLVLVLYKWLGPFFNVSQSARYLPWLLLGLAFDRVCFVPERLLIRHMSFRRVAFGRSLGDLTYSVASVGLAMTGLGGFAIIYANVARSLLRAFILTTGVPAAEWLTPARLSRKVYAEILGFGAPVAGQSVLGYAASRWDNLLFARMFGAGAMAKYNLAYNFADISAVQIGEQIAEVLQPSFARMPPPERDRAVVESTGLVALVLFPLSVGLGAISNTLVHTILPPQWQDLAPMLTMLAVLSAARPLAWQAGAYFLANNMPRVGLVVDAIKLCVLVVAMLTLGRLGQLWATLAVGIAFLLAVYICWWVIAQQIGAKVRTFVAQCVPPAAACCVMVAAILGVRWGWTHAGIRVRGVGLGLEMVAGAAAYVAAALVVARRSSRKLIELFKRAYSRRRAAA